MAAIENLKVNEDGAYEFQLRIKNFAKSTEKCYDSKLTLDQATEWSIRIYPDGARPEYKGYTSILLRSHNKSRPEIEAIFSCLIVGKSKKNRIQTFTHQFKSGETYGWTRYIYRKKIYTYNRVLTLSFKIKLVFVKFEPYSALKDPVYSLKPGTRQKLFTDLTLKVQGKEIKAHKVYLAEASEKFLEMLSKDPNENVLEVMDLDFEIAEKIIQFIYEDQIEGIENSARAFLTVAEEYKMDRLKKYCQKSMCESLTVENVFEILEFCINHDYQELKMECIEFMARHISDIPKPNWTGFIKDSPDLFVKLFKHCIYLNYKKIHEKLELDPVSRYRKFGEPTKFQERDQDFSYLYMKDKFSDVKLKIGEHSLQAHKAVLSSRSSVFKAMFEHDTKESQESEVVVDFSLETMKELLRYIYCGTVFHVQKVALDLLPAADYYNLPELVEVCEDSMLTWYSIGDLPEYYQIADLHNRAEFKAAIVRRFGSKILEYLESAELLKMIKNNPDSFNNIFVELIKEFF